MDLLQIAITVALSTVANQAGSPLIKAGYNRLSRKNIDFQSSQLARHFVLCNGSLKYRVLLFPVFLPLDVSPIDVTELSSIQLHQEVQRCLQLLLSIRSSYNPSDMVLPSDNVTAPNSFNLSDRFSLTPSGLFPSDQVFSFQMCSCPEHKNKAVPLSSESTELSGTLALKHY